MREPEIASVKRPQSQPNREKKVSSSNLQESPSFEKKLKNSYKKINSRDNGIDDLILAFADMSTPVEWDIGSLKFGGAEPIRLKEAAAISRTDAGLRIDASSAHKQLRGDSGHKDGASASSTTERTESQQEILARLLAYFKNAWIPFPITDLSLKLDSLRIRPEASEIADKIVESASMLKVNGKAELVLNLKPQWLGDLKMNISSENGTLTIQIFANERTKDLIESQLEELKQMLAEAKLDIGSLNVSVGGHDTGQRGSGDDSPLVTAAAPGPFVPVLIGPSSAKDFFGNADGIAMTMRRLMIYSEV